MHRPSRCTASITGNSHTDSRTISPRGVASHHSKNGSRSISGYSGGGTTQPAAQLMKADCGWMSQSNQL